ncbi:glycosyltransferase family 2 protein [Tropicimonas sp. TH_r6]|uniref:glycosyltransferase family 2 protein n=1 Tax=Tropicimonas sp. TH_r6 TaxID=3082085 RepID=UPI002952E4F6|nr:glycosyltransferase family 2 protein [Tropicimonas sp. TH_r6]MDV7144009.1 glycosyltransferase family 2 protein [Tropicimonas sp. TH_r6]
MPTFSIVIPCYNAARTLPDTLDSLLAQDFEDWEAICVDDGSTDETIDLLKTYAARDSRIRPARNPGKGPSAARNHAALTLARGALIAFLDSDDIWMPDKLARTATAFENPVLHASFARIAFFDARPDEPSTFSTVPDRPLSLDDLLGENPVCTMSNVTVHHSVFIATGGFDKSIVHNEDLEWLIRLVGEGYEISALNEVLVSYRASPNGLSADIERMRVGRAAAMATARRFGARPLPRHEAIHLRYLARRALRMQSGRLLPLRLSLQGIRTSPSGFFSDVRRGALVTLASLLVPFLPRRVSHAIVSR